MAFDRLVLKGLLTYLLTYFSISHTSRFPTQPLGTPKSVKTYNFKTTKNKTSTFT